MQVPCDLLVQLPYVVQDMKQWRNIAFCLSQLSVGDKGFHKLADMFAAYKDSLGDPQVYSCFQVYIITSKEINCTCH